MDRERWFNAVMGEDYKVDPPTTERLASSRYAPGLCRSRAGVQVERHGSCWNFLMQMVPLLLVFRFGTSAS